MKWERKVDLVSFGFAKVMRIVCLNSRWHFRPAIWRKRDCCMINCWPCVRWWYSDEWSVDLIEYDQSRKFFQLNFWCFSAAFPHSCSSDLPRNAFGSRSVPFFSVEDVADVAVVPCSLSLFWKDCRWEVITNASDDRTAEEKGLEVNGEEVKCGWTLLLQCGFVHSSRWKTTVIGSPSHDTTRWTATSHPRRSPTTTPNWSWMRISWRRCSTQVLCRTSTFVQYGEYEGWTQTMAPLFAPNYGTPFCTKLWHPLFASNYGTPFLYQTMAPFFAPNYGPPFLHQTMALPCYWMIDWMIDVRCLQLFPLFSEKPFCLWSLIFFHSED